MEAVRTALEGFVSPENMDLVVQKAHEGAHIVIRVFSNRAVLAVTGGVVGLYWYMTRTHKFFTDLGIPGPNPGIFGALSDYSKKPVSEYDIEVMKEYGKVVGIFHMHVPQYLITDADIIRQVFVKEFSTFVNRESSSYRFYDPAFESSLFVLHDDRWRFMRSTLSPTFTSGRMREMAGLIQVCVAALVDNVWRTSQQGTKAMEMMSVYGLFSMDAIATTAFGFDAGCQENPEDNVFIKQATKLMKPGFRTFGLFFLYSAIPGFGKLAKWLNLPFSSPNVTNFFAKAVRDAIEQRRGQNKGRNDFLQLMLNSHKLEVNKEEEDPDTVLEFDRTKRRGMTEDEIISNALLFFLAGYDTTSTSLSFLSYNLATNPECQERLIEEIDTVLQGATPDYDNVQKLQYMENCFLETLRMNPPSVRNGRVASQDIEINGVLIKKNVDVQIPLYALHHDPDYWSDPDTFNPDRFLPENRPENFNYVFLPFGAGPRNCIGMRLAHMQSKMAIVGILQKYRFKTLPETKIPLELEKMTLKPADGIKLGVEER